MIVACVLRSGGCYDADDVAHLRDGVFKHWPDADFVCLSDMPVPCARIPLVWRWPGWWSKLNLLSPAIKGDCLYLDLDSIITGPIADLGEMSWPTIMRDVYRPDGLQSSVMFIPQWMKADVWAKWMADPQGHMQRYADGGDQAFLEDHSGPWQLWQDVKPGRLVSYKVDVQPTGKVPAGASVVVFHGQPKPREFGWAL